MNVNNSLTIEKHNQHCRKGDHTLTDLIENAHAIAEYGLTRELPVCNTVVAEAFSL